MESAIRERIQGLIDGNDVVLFMKGTRTMPQCGFSATVVQILDSLVEGYGTVNVLADPEIRQGIKDFSDWPTIPQLYVKGEFVGGCDIIKDMFENGQLEESLGVELPEIPPPHVTVSDAAVAALQAANPGENEFVRLEIDARFRHGLSIGERGARDIEVDVGALKLMVDRGSAKRAEGVVIDYVDTPDGKAFKIKNPNEPPGVQEVTPEQMQQKLDAGEALELYDVRTDQELQTASIKGAKKLDRSAQDHLMKLPKDTPLYFLCHHGNRSGQAAEFFLNQGFTQVFNIVGGIDAWSRDVNPDIPRY